MTEHSAERSAKRARLSPYACAAGPEGTLRCVPTDRLSEPGMRRVGGTEYRTADQCERECGLWTGLPPELRYQAAELLPRQQRARLASASQTERALLRDTHDPCEYLRQEHPRWWRLLASADGRTIDAARCARFGLACSPQDTREAAAENCRVVVRSLQLRRRLSRPLDEPFLIRQVHFELLKPRWMQTREFNATEDVIATNPQFYDRMQEVFDYVLTGAPLGLWENLRAGPVLREGQTIEIVSAPQRSQYGWVAAPSTARSAPLSFADAVIDFPDPDRTRGAYVTVEVPLDIPLMAGTALSVRGSLDFRAEADLPPWFVEDAPWLSLWAGPEFPARLANPLNRRELEGAVRAFLRRYGLPTETVETSTWAGITIYRLVVPVRYEDDDDDDDDEEEHEGDAGRDD